MATKYLDSTGLAHLVSKLKTYVTNAVKVTGVKGNAETSYRTGNVNLTAANVGAVATSGNETVSGNKTFTGTTTIEATSVVRNQVGQVIVANANAVIQSPIPKYIWHDVLAFNRATTPKYYTTSDGTTWTEATLDKRLFIHKEAWGKINILDSTISGSRWTWIGGGLAYCSATWLVIGVAYANPISKFNVLLETSSGSDDSATWTTLVDVSGISVNQNPIWIRTNTTSTSNIRLTITRNSESASTTTLPITSIRWLTTRWGDQGKGSEFEYPYQWNESNTIFPITNNESDLGGTSYKWKNLFATTLNASNMGNNTKLLFPQTSGSDTGIEVTNATNSLGILFGIGSGQVNRGIYDRKLSKWLIYADNSNVYLNGTVVPSSPKFTDTVTTVTTAGSGNAVTAVTASKGALTVTKGTTFLTSHQDISGKADKSATVSNVAYDSTNKKLTKTINGTTSDVVTLSTLKTAMSLGNVDNTADANKSVASAAKLTTTRHIDGLAFSGSADVCRLCAYENTTQVDNVDTVSVRAVDGSTINDRAGTIIAVMFGNGVNDGNKKLRLHYEDNTYSTPAYIFKTAGERLVEAIPQNSVYMFVHGVDFGLSIDGWFMIGYYDTRATYYAMTQAQATAGSSTTSMLISPKVLSTTIANAVGESGTADNIVDITNQFSSSNSRIKITSAYKVGKTVTVRFDVTRTSAIANGSEVQAQITSQYLPLLTETSTRMWGSGFLIATFVGKDGVVNQTSNTYNQGYLWFRNSSGSSISKSSTVTLPITITYIYDDGTIS